MVDKLMFKALTADTPELLQSDTELVKKLLGRCEHVDKLTRAKPIYQDTRVWVAKAEREQLKRIVGLAGKPKAQRMRLRTVRTHCDKAMELLEQRTAALMSEKLAPPSPPKPNLDDLLQMNKQWSSAMHAAASRPNSLRKIVP